MKIHILEAETKFTKPPDPEVFVRLNLQFQDEDGDPWIDLRGCLLWPERLARPGKKGRPAVLRPPSTPYNVLRIPIERQRDLADSLMAHPKVKKAFGEAEGDDPEGVTG